MANTLGTTNADVIAQEALKQLQAALPILGQIATDHSKENARFGETIIIHEVAAASATAFNPAVGYTPSDRAQVDIPVVLNKHKHHTYGVSVQEASSSRVDLIKRFGLNAAYSLGAAIVADLCALITNENFPNKTTKALGAGGDGFDRKSVIAVGAALSKRGVPPLGRFMLLNPDYYGSLSMDLTMLQVMMARGAQAVESGKLPNVHGFEVSEFVDLPTNEENLVGFAGTRTALALATRLPDDPGQGEPNCRISTVTDENTGLSMQVREWYEPTLAQYRRTFTIMYGVAVGQKAALQRIVSA
ncbi:hypothetical protein [Thermosphaera sp.]